MLNANERNLIKEQIATYRTNVMTFDELKEYFWIIQKNSLDEEIDSEWTDEELVKYLDVTIECSNSFDGVMP